MQIDYNAEDKENEIFSLSFLNLSSDVIFPSGSVSKEEDIEIEGVIFCRSRQI